MTRRESHSVQPKAPVAAPHTRKASRARTAPTVQPLPHGRRPALTPDDHVRVEALRGYVDTVTALGGDPARLLARARIPGRALQRPDARIPYRAMAALLELTADALDCPDFGLRLAARQGGTPVLGPLDRAMRNTATIGDAFRYCAEHLQVYSRVVKIALDDESSAGRHVMHFGILLRDLPARRQVVENALGLAHRAVLDLSGGSFGAREIWFAHGPGMPMARYRRHFSGVLRFQAPYDAVVFHARDFARPIANRDGAAFAQAALEIELNYPPRAVDLVNRVRLLVTHSLQSGTCTPQAIAAQLGLEGRTLQRHLQQAGTSFESIKDEIRRDAAVHYLRNSTLTVTRIAALLGYSETSVLTHSCQRWFGCSPRAVRAQDSR